MSAALTPSLADAIRFLASCCDGAVRRDGVGFARDHVEVGALLATTPECEWDHRHRRAAVLLVHLYRRQLESAGFDTWLLLKGRRGHHQFTLAPSGWFADPTGVARWRWWNGRRWTEHISSGSARADERVTATTSPGRSR